MSAYFLKHHRKIYIVIKSDDAPSLYVVGGGKVIQD